MRCAVLFFAAAAALAQATDPRDRLRECAGRGDHACSAGVYRELLRSAPDDAQLLSNLGISLVLANKPAEAIPYLKRALRVSPKAVPPTLFLGLALVATGRATEALPMLERAAAQDAGPLPALGLARAYLQLREHRRANEYFGAVAAKAPQHSEAWFGLAITYRNLLDDAVLRLVRADEKRARAAAAVEDTESTAPSREELAALEQASSKENPDVLERLARAYAALSLSAVEKASRLEPDSIQARLVRAEVHRVRLRYQEAIAEYETAIRRWPDSAAARLGLATAHWKSGQQDAARRWAEEVLRLAPEDAEAHTILADVAFRDADTASALQFATRALRRNPDLPHARLVLAKCYLSEDRAEAAVTELRKIIAQDRDGSYHYVLSRALQKAGRPAEARETLAVYRRLRADQAEPPRDAELTSESTQK